MESNLKSRQESEEARILEMLRSGQLVRVLDLMERQGVDRAAAERAIRRFRSEQGSLWHQLKHAAFG